MIVLAPKHRSSENERLWLLCILNAIESEVHVLIHCNRLRQPLLDRAYTVNPNFNSLTDKLCFVLTDPNMCRISAKTCFNILNSRMLYL